MSEEQIQPVAKMLHLANTPTAFTDAVNIACRVDGCVLLQFISETPAVAIENFRTMMTRENVTQLIDSLAKALNHYPAPEAPASDSPNLATKKKVSRVKS